MENEPQNVLQDFEQELNLQPAGTGLRFVNYLIDVIGYYIFFIVIVYLGLVPIVNQALIDKRDESASAGELIGIYLFAYLVFFLYYFLSEGLLKGKTLGKLITGTLAVQESGNPISWRDAVLRSLSRLVPFEVFSALGVRPWHDRWTKTMVIKRR